MSKKTLYLANPYGFNRLMAEGPLLEIQGKLETMGFEVWEPFQRNNQHDRTDLAAFYHRVGQCDKNDVRDCDGVLAITDGCPPDEGVMVEVGMAIAWKRPVFFYRADTRHCSDTSVYPLNIMLFVGLADTEVWKRYWYTDVADLDNPDKALALFASGEPLPGFLSD